MKKTFVESAIASTYALNIREKYGMLWPDSLTAGLYQVFFSAVTNTLKTHQTKKNPKIGFKFDDDRGNFLFGAIMSYHEPEEKEEDEKGNWFLEYTFNKEDMTDLNEIYDNHAIEFIKISEAELNSILFGHFETSNDMQKMFSELVIVLRDFLESQANVDDVYELELMDVFTATAGIEDGEKVISITPSATMKQIVKNDSAL